MRKFFTPFFLLFFLSLTLNGIKLHGQQRAARVKNMLTAGVKNYTSFTEPNTANKQEAITHNPGYEQHPEVGQLYADAPCDNCYELIGKRTEQSKLFVKMGTDGKDVMQQTCSGPMHYRGPNGEWLTIKSQLVPLKGVEGTYAAMEQEAPVVISVKDRYCSLGKNGQQIRFNNDLELFTEWADGPEHSLGKADYSHYTAGDDGVYVTDAWPGIDIEMYVVRGAIKTNFILKRAMPELYKSSGLVIRDNPKLEEGWSIHYDGTENYTGNYEVRNASGERVYAMSGVTAYEKADLKNTMQHLATTYALGADLDIHVPAEMLHRPNASYPIVIDPLVTLATSSSINGSTYSSGWTTGCVYTNPATVPAGVTVTDVQFTFQYITGGGAVLNNGAYDFKLGTCRSPSVSTLYWNCNSLLTGTCDAILATIYPQIYPCLPPAQCTSYNMNLTMDFYQNYASTSACSPTYIMAGTPLTITVSGHTVEAGTITATASGICQGQSAVLTASSLYGVAPFTYTWLPGGATGVNDTVSPAVTTTYTVISTDACGNSNSTTKTITVNPVSTISGVATVCVGGTSALSCTPAGGTWASTNTAIATVGSASGTLGGVAAGTTVVSYTTAAGCSTGTPVTVKAAVLPITGYLSVCAGSTTSLIDATPLGTWSSSNTSVAIIGSTSGFVSGITGGTATISYTTYGGGCYAVAPLTVNPLSAISGSLTLCVGGSTTLSDLVPGGTWSETSPNISVGSSSGIVSGISTGSAGVTYTTPAGCIATTTVVVNFLNPITGTASVCQGSTTTLSDAAPSGVWSSSNTSVATVGSSSGTVTGVAGGTALISYSVPGGCFTTKIVTVNPVAGISGTPGVCVGGTTTLSDIVTPGIWSSTNTSVATIGSISGVMTGVAVGTATITYTSGAGCIMSIPVSITLPTPITGTPTVCQGSTTTLGNITTGGVWASSNPLVAVAGSSSGVVTGLNGGIVTITYTTPAGCAVMTPVTVNADPPLTGADILCVGTTTTLSSTSLGGTWTSGATGVATVDVSSGVVSGVANGTAPISYTTTAGCIAATTVTVNVPSAITGSMTVCQGSSTALSDAVSGGVWSSSNTSIASVGSLSGVVTGMTGGSVTINYATAGGCNAALAFTVNPLSLITGSSTVCAGGNIALSDATTGGTWTSGSTVLAIVGSLTGVVTGVAPGTVAINYTTGAGCVTNTLVTVNSAPSAISGSTLVCSTTTLSDGVSGGLWTSGNTLIAAVGPTTGVVTAISPGVDTITYTLSGGCRVSTAVTVDPLTSISGTPNVCQGSTTALSYPTPGGTWTSLSTSVATVDTSGSVTGVAPGTATIRYTTATGCIASTLVTVFALQPITGTPSACQGNTTTLSDLTSGGSWASGSTAVATVGATTGIVSGISGGTALISYTTAAGCTATRNVTVNAQAPVIGLNYLCAGDSTTLTNAVSGGAWSSTSPTTASVDATSGTVYALIPGTTTIRYTTSAGCISNMLFTVNALPSAISGSNTVCQAQTTTLTNTLTGGTWVSNDPLIATIGATTGVVTGMTAGATVMSYTTTAGCYAVLNFTVNPLQATTGIGSICAGDNTTLVNLTPGGGTWTSAPTTVATVGLMTGTVTGISAGTAVIKFTTPLGCVTNFNETINAVPTVPTVSGGGLPKVCVAGTITLSNTILGGTWTSANPAAATVGASTGIVTGVTADTATIVYATVFGCSNSVVVTVNPLPHSITGTTSICAGATTTLSDATPLGTWSSLSPAVATIGSATGFVNGITAGTATMKYTTPEGCSTSVPFTVNAMPTAITGIASVCEGSITTLYNTLAGGSWTSSLPGTATIGIGSGVVSGVAAGITTITYSTPAGCYVTRNVTVNPTPVLNSYSSTGPTTCVTNDGTITLNGLTPGATYVVSYLAGPTPVTVTLAADASGKIKIYALAAGSYSNFKVATILGCTSNTLAGPIVLSLPAPPPAPAAGNNTPICEGVTLTLTATDATPGVAYSWSGPGGFTSTQQNPVLGPSTMAEAGTYTVTATALGCVSLPAMTVVVVHPIPHITSIYFTDPSTCQGTDGTVTLGGLLASVTYTVDYQFNGTPASATVVANASGNVVVTGLASGTYSNFSVSSYTCLSNSMGPVTLKDPNPPPAPKLTATSPICSGKTLALNAYDAITGLSYDWSGPNGFRSDLADPTVPNISMADSGLYSLTIRYLNCPTTATVNVLVYPPVKLTGITPDQLIPFGSSIKLSAAGAEFYLWSPDDGSLSNPNIDSPIATPMQNTVYIVEGMNKWGCVDSAQVSITLDLNITIGIPNAFTPNGDGHNDVFKIENVKYDKLVDFSVFNRWGQLVYHNGYDVTQGWDGTFNGVPQDMGTYDYRIVLCDPNGKMKYFNGSVILVR